MCPKTMKRRHELHVSEPYIIVVQHKLNEHVHKVLLKRRPCRLQTVQTVQTVQTECYFFHLYLNFLVNFLLLFPEGASTMEEGKLFLSVTVLYCHDYLNFF